MLINEIDDDNEIILNNPNIQDEENKINICDNYIFICFFYIIESLISIVCFYLFYRFKIGDKNNKIYEIIEFVLLGLLFFSYIFLYNLIDLLNKCQNKISRNIFQFILINFHKLCLFFFLYLIIVLNGEKRIDFPHFEARAYWKISICILYLLLSFYYYFKKDKYSEKAYIYILFAAISLLTYFFLTFFTKRSSDNWDRLWIYIICMYFEIISSMLTIYLYKSDEIEKEKNNEKNIRILDWKINEIDLLKYLIVIFPVVIWTNIKEYYQKIRFCQKLKQNFSI